MAIRKHESLSLCMKLFSGRWCFLQPLPFFVAAFLCSHFLSAPLESSLQPNRLDSLPAPRPQGHKMHSFVPSSGSFFFVFKFYLGFSRLTFPVRTEPRRLKRLKTTTELATRRVLAFMAREGRGVMCFASLPLPRHHWDPLCGARGKAGRRPLVEHGHCLGFILKSRSRDKSLLQRVER